MATETLAARLDQLESRVQEVEAQITMHEKQAASQKRGWRWFIGIDANNPDFEEAVRLGQEWRNADRPQNEEQSA